MVSNNSGFKKYQINEIQPISKSGEIQNLKDELKRAQAKLAQAEKERDAARVKKMHDIIANIQGTLDRNNQ